MASPPGPPRRLEPILPVPIPTPPPPRFIRVNFNPILQPAPTPEREIPPVTPMRDFYRKICGFYSDLNFGTFLGKQATPYQNRQKHTITRVILPALPESEDSEGAVVDLVSMAYSMYLLGYKQLNSEFVMFCSDYGAFVGPAMEALKIAEDEDGNPLYQGQELIYSYLPYDGYYKKNFMNYKKSCLDYIPRGKKGVCKIFKNLLAHGNDEKFHFSLLIIIFGEGVRLRQIQEHVLAALYGQDPGVVNRERWAPMRDSIKEFGKISKLFKFKRDHHLVCYYLYTRYKLLVDDVIAIVNLSDRQILELGLGPAGDGRKRPRGYGQQLQSEVFTFGSFYAGEARFWKSFHPGSKVRLLWKGDSPFPLDNLLNSGSQCKGDSSNPSDGLVLHHSSNDNHQLETEVLSFGSFTDGDAKLWKSFPPQSKFGLLWKGDSPFDLDRLVNSGSQCKGDSAYPLDGLVLHDSSNDNHQLETEVFTFGSFDAGEARFWKSFHPGSKVRLLWKGDSPFPLDNLLNSGSQCKGDSSNPLDGLVLHHCSNDNHQLETEVLSFGSFTDGDAKLWKSPQSKVGLLWKGDSPFDLDRLVNSGSQCKGDSAYPLDGLVLHDSSNDNHQLETGASVSSAPKGQSVHPRNFLPRGLVNLGNLCFMNATLQALLSCSPFFELLCKLRDCDLKQIDYPTLHAFVKFIANFDLPTESIIPETGLPFHPAMFDSVLKSFTPDIAEYLSARPRQEDAQEFLGFVLNMMQEELLKLDRQNGDGKTASLVSSTEGEDEYDDCETAGPKKTTANTKSFVPLKWTSIFGGQLRSVVEAKGRKASATVQAFLLLHLNISSDSVHSVDGALKKYCATENLEGYRTSAGEEVEDAFKSVKILELPEVLVLHLVRSEYGIQGSTKLDKYVHFPLELLISSELLASTSSQGRVYELVATVTHHGSDTSEGHYTADALHPNGKWLRYDDAVVTPITEIQVQHGQAYVLFYRQSQNRA